MIIQRNRKRERLGKIYKHRGELKKKTPDDLAKLPAEDLDKYVSVADARRIKYLANTQSAIERQGALRDVRRKRHAVEMKGKRIADIVSDATSRNVAKFKAGDHRLLKSFGTGVKEVANNVLGVAEKAVGVAMPACALCKGAQLFGAQQKVAEAKADTEIAKAGMTKLQSDKATGDFNRRHNFLGRNGASLASASAAATFGAKLFAGNPYLMALGALGGGLGGWAFGHWIDRFS
jgi:hypothetical protein